MHGEEAEPALPLGTGAAAFDAFFRSTYPRIVGLVAAATGDGANAEDAAQEAFVRLALRWGRVDDPEPWVAKVALRLAIDAWRRRKREAPVAGDEEAPLVDPIRRLWARWHLDQLTPGERITCIRHYHEGLTVAEVGELTRRSRQTVKSQLFTARRRLRALRRGEHA